MWLRAAFAASSARPLVPDAAELKQKLDQVAAALRRSL
jgi:hypothetical protein